MVDGRVVDSNMDGSCSFSSNLYAVLVYYQEVADVSLGIVVGNEKPVYSFKSLSGAEELSLTYFNTLHQG